MNLVLRKATIADLPKIAYWNTKPHVIFASGVDSVGEDQWMTDQLNSPSQFVEIFIAELDKRPIGIIQICDPANEETHYWGQIEHGNRALDIWIGEEQDLGKGYGSVMMKLAIEHCFEDKSINAILIDPLETNTRAIRFYQKMGFKFLEKRNFDGDQCEVYILSRSRVEELKKD